jgi:hypothetical protein
MWLRRFQAQELSPNYRDVELVFDHVNVFLGRNNSGKSRLLYTLYQLAQAEVWSRDPEINTYASGFTLDKVSELLRTDSGQFPFRYLPVDRTPTPILDTRRIDEFRHSERERGGVGVDDILVELHDVPLLRPRVQFEIERLFGISLSFEMEGYNLRCYADDDLPATRLLLNQHGRGVQYYASLFFYLYHPDVRVLLVDEPENSLHPQLQRAFITRVRRIAREQDKQVFLATHSPILALPEKADDLNGVFLLQRNRSPSRVLSLSSVVPDDPVERQRFDSFLPNLDPGIAELFFAASGLIVEGQTERQFMQYLATRTGRDSHQRGVTIVESNGLGLMSGLIRLTGLILPHWRAVCDKDLLTTAHDRFAGYRQDLGNVLGIEVPRTKTDDEFRSVQELLWAHGVSVSSKSGLEEHYVSPAMKKYRTKRKSVDPKDKGWLLAQEIEFLQQKDSEFVNITYSDLLAPLDALLADVEVSAFRPRSMKELIRDTLFTDADRIHREAYRQQWDEERLSQFIARSRSLATYDLDFRASGDYELHWKDRLGGQYRIRCEGEWFFVEYAEQPSGQYEVLRRGTVGEKEEHGTSLSFDPAGFG